MAGPAFWLGCRLGERGISNLHFLCNLDKLDTATE